MRMHNSIRGRVWGRSGVLGMPGERAFIYMIEDTEHNDLEGEREDVAWTQTSHFLAR